MKKIVGLFCLVFGLAQASFAEDNCVTGYQCEVAPNGEVVLRLTTSYVDESLNVCQVQTIKNFKTDSVACLEAAAQLNNQK